MCPDGHDQALGSRYRPGVDVLPNEPVAARRPTPSSWLAAGAAALVIAVVGTVLVAVGRGPSADSNGDPATMVHAAAQKTLAQRSAAVSLRGTVSVAGRTLSLTGSGMVDFAAGAMSLDMTTQLGGNSLDQRERFVGGRMYLAMDIAGHDIAEYTGGRHWLGMPVMAQPSQLGNGDPLTELELLAARGNTVTSLGTKTVDGVKVTGYAITPTREAMRQNMQRAIASMNLSAAERAQFQRMIAAFHLNPPTIDAWFDASGLLRTMRMQMSFGGAVSGAGSVDMTFGHYGTAVHVTAPAPGDVVSYADFLRKMQSAGVKLP